MRLKLDDNGYIKGYATIGGFVDDIEVDDSLLEEIQKYDGDKLQFCKYADGKITFDEANYNIWKEKSDKEAADYALQMKYIPTQTQSMNQMLKVMAVNQINTAIKSQDSEAIIELSGYINTWTPGKYEVNDLVNIKGQTWECFQAHDNAVYPDINPDNSAWFTFWRPLHATTEETARPFVPVQGAHDMYKVGQYCVYGENETVYKCIQDTNFSPDEYANAWQKIKDNKPASDITNESEF